MGDDHFIRPDNDVEEKMFVVTVWDVMNDCPAKSFFGVSRSEAQRLMDYYATDILFEVSMEECELE
jgi:hypothetical protein